jgi:hypothetical protein
MQIKETEFQDNNIIRWLMNGDPSIRWQVVKDLLDQPVKVADIERCKISEVGWGKKLLSKQDKNEMWSGSLYHHKWISTTYTMLLLKSFGLSPNNSKVKKACKILLDKGFYSDGGINYFSSLNHSETCVTGMILSLVSYFQYVDQRIFNLAEFLLKQQMADGGWNCQSFRGAKHSSFHTTISVLEGLREFEKFNIKKTSRIRRSQLAGIEFLLNHRLFRSHRTGKIFDSRMTRFSFPPRWRYDVLRVLDYFQEANIPYDERMKDALELVLKRKCKDGKWFLQSRHPGKTYFEMEQVGKPSRWNTLRALRVLKKYNVIF